MLQKQKKWTYPLFKPINQVFAETSLQLSDITKDILAEREIISDEAAKAFLYPDLKALHPSSLLNDIEKTAERIHKAIETGERILIYGDYDADGVTSITLLLETLEELGAYCDYYIPNRFTEGYGPNEKAFRKAHEAGVTLIITVDNGIAANHEAEVCKELGMDLIITDHHEQQDALPDAFAIIHPKCSPEYPFKDLAGVGVAFKLSTYLLGYFPEKFLDLVAVGTIADLVSLTDENRVLVYYGLKALTQTKRPGFQAIKEIAKIEGHVTEEDVGFIIGPRLNAVGRLQTADLAVNLLKTEDLFEAKEIALEVEKINVERKKIVQEIYLEAKEIIRKRYGSDLPGVLIVSKEGWNEGVLGIVASKLVRIFDRPAIVLSKKIDTGIIKGSARSIPAFDLFENCMKIRGLFNGFGGHSQAAGMTLSIENEEELLEQLDKLIKGQLSEEDFKQEIVITRSIAIEEATEELVEDLELLAPFGMDNPKPIFEIKEIPTDMKQLGNEKNHLKLIFNKEGKAIEGMGFGFGDYYHEISPQTPVSIVGELGINEWNGFRKVQMMIKDMSIDEWQLFDYRGKKAQQINNILDSTKKVVIVHDNEHSSSKEEIQTITYGIKKELVPEIEILILKDMPPHLEALEHILKMTQPDNIYVCFYVEKSMYMKAMPSHEDFKWFYKFIVKQGILDLNKDLKKFLDYKGWSKDWVVFISKVFRELGFITIENKVIFPVETPEKKDLNESALFQARMELAEVEKILYYSTYNELKKWFLEHGMNENKSEKEGLFINGL